MIIAIPVLFGLAVVGLLYLLFWSRADRDYELLEDKIAEIDGFEASSDLIACDQEAGIGLDWDKKRLCLVRRLAGTQKLELAVTRPITHRLALVEDLMSVEVFEDDVSVTKTSRSSQIGGAVVGAVLAGGIGTLIGGLSAKTSTRKSVEKIEVRLRFATGDWRTFDIVVMNRGSDSFLNQGGSNRDYQEGDRIARDWCAIFDGLIHQTRKSQVATVVPASSSSLGDEIKKLADLHQSGALSDSEFTKMKAKLLES